ncbi:MAG: hypothetical protein OEZ15_01055 [Gammaproteobacteria bacterium]|nr:hypothetical protein [Gammaproteobacteria bacterium]
MLFKTEKQADIGFQLSTDTVNLNTDINLCMKLIGIKKDQRR